MYVTRARSPASARLKIDIDTPPDPGRTAVQAAADFYNVFTQRVDSQVFAIGRDSESSRQPEKCPTRRNPLPKVGISPSVQEPCYPHSPSLSVSSSLSEAKTGANPGLSERQRSSKSSPRKSRSTPKSEPGQRSRCRHVGQVEITPASVHAQS